MKHSFMQTVVLIASLSLCACKKKCINEGYYQVPAFLSLTPAKEEYKIGIDTIHLKVEIPFKSFTLTRGTPIDVENYKPNDIYFSIGPILFKNGNYIGYIPDPIGKGLIDTYYNGKRTNSYGRKALPFSKTDSSWLFSISLLPVSDTLSGSLIQIRNFPHQYQDNCVLIEYSIQPRNTNPNWHLPMSFSPNNDYRPYAQDFYFMLK
jgi:hypothetical protein